MAVSLTLAFVGVLPLLSSPHLAREPVLRSPAGA